MLGERAGRWSLLRLCAGDFGLLKVEDGWGERT